MKPEDSEPCVCGICGVIVRVGQRIYTLEMDMVVCDGCVPAADVLLQEESEDQSLCVRLPIIFSDEPGNK